MKIGIINGSPKKTGSASGILAGEFTGLLEQAEITECHIYNRGYSIPPQLSQQDALVFFFPLYVDAIPSQLLSFLENLEEELRGRDITVYAAVNSGFCEGRQNRWALEIMENWCGKTGLKWGQGLGIGGGGMLTGIESVPPGKGPKKYISKGLSEMAAHVKSRQNAENIYVSINFPRRLYILMAQIGWRQQLKRNGLKLKDLKRVLVKQ